jgi:quercetin dioxygenase-like cupin family protein
MFRNRRSRILRVFTLLLAAPIVARVATIAQASATTIGQSKRASRVTVVTLLMAAGVLSWMIGQHYQVNAAAQRGAQSIFSGGNPIREDTTSLRNSRLRFPAGSRTHWHSHSWGQLLMIEEGRGRTQVRGGPVLEMLPGQPWFTPAGVEHWHGAAPNQEALQLGVFEGTLKPLEPVSDKEYLAAPASRR